MPLWLGEFVFRDGGSRQPQVTSPFASSPRLPSDRQLEEWALVVGERLRPLDLPSLLLRARRLNTDGYGKHGSQCRRQTHVDGEIATEI